MQQHRARKRFGQNFLQDQRIIAQIVSAIRPTETDHLVEIGPGQGALTALLLEKNPCLEVIELDRDLIPGLRTQFFRYPELKIHAADALSFDFASLQQDQRPLRIVGNLPYNISTPLIFHLLEFQGLVKDMHFMLQKEVVERLAAVPGTGQWGRLSIMTQYYCQVESLFEVPPESFHPRPAVDSAVVRLTPHAPEAPAGDVSLLAATVRQAFSQRRKTLRNNLKGILTDDQLMSLDIDPQRRPETLTLNEYVRLANFRANLLP